MTPFRFLMVVLSMTVIGCAYQLEYEPGYVAPETPSFVADAEILILMHPHDTEYVFQGSPTSAVGEFTTLTIPLGNIMQEITADVFQSCFAFGVVFTPELTRDMRYLIAIEPEIRNFSFRYDRISLDTAEEQIQRSVTTPKVQFDLAVKAYGTDGLVVLERTYGSGLYSGESYEITNRPYERINATVHSALQQIMLEVAEDVRPLLVGQCTITDLAG